MSSGTVDMTIRFEDRATKTAGASRLPIVNGVYFFGCSKRQAANGGVAQLVRASA